MNITVINGPNLNLLGVREPSVYGTDTLQDIEAKIRMTVHDTGAQLSFFQSNSEGEIINLLHAARFENNANGIVLNPGAYTHYSIAIRDAISSIEIPVIEVHLSNIHAREPFRHLSVVAGVCKGRIEGLGWYGYAAAILALVEMEKK